MSDAPSSPGRPQLPGQRDGTPDAGERRYTRRLTADVWHGLRSAAAGHALAPEVVLVAAFARTIADWAKEPRFSIGVGAPIPVDADPDLAFADCARTVRRGWPYPALPLRVDAAVVHDASEEDGGLLLNWDATALRLPPGLLADLVDTQLDLLKRLAREPAAWTGPAPDRLPERQRPIREQVNATGAPLPDELLHEPFWRQADRTPGAPAVIAADRTVTYGELRSAAHAVADRLPAGAMVALVLDKGWQQAAAVLGTLAAGAAYVPITPDLPAERFHHLLQHCEAVAAITSPELAATQSWPEGLPLVTVDDSTLTGPDRPAPPRLRAQTDLAYVIYTSGSTGSPKGVMIDHRGAFNTITDINTRFGIGASDRVFALSSLAFDLSVYDILGPLSAGGAVVMPAPGSGRAPWDWAETITEHSVTVWNTVPALMEMLVEYSAGRGLRITDSLRLVLMSGDWIPVSLPDRIRSLTRPGIELIGAGGATEASIWSNFYPIGEVDPAWGSIPYGKPLTNQHFEVLDTALRRRPDWVPGQLHIGGLGVAMGYWRDEQRTEDSFITHPRTGQRLYRTGDLGRYLPDGNLEFLGREDFQVKINGFRVELGEIEAALLSHEEVTAGIVIAVGAAGGERRLAAYVTPSDVPAAELREHLAAKLPAYLLPDHIVTLDAFPLTGNGKVDRKALPSPGERQA